MSRRTERVGDLWLETLSELLLKEVNDPRVGPVTLTGVQVDPDLRRVRVRFCTLGGESGREGAEAGLRSASRFLQGRAARAMRMKYTPKLEFEYDEGFDHAARMDRLLKDLPGTEGSAMGAPDPGGVVPPDSEDE